jgi:hypothetical protein
VRAKNVLVGKREQEPSAGRFWQTFDLEARKVQWKCN